mmetsp:Transcript_83115/g.268905  ORF Transcript_83115/g.268905 Transcript_83115/m.268905 type:complete len:237 (+) Transcript_83115:1091-1801(+)
MAAAVQLNDMGVAGPLSAACSLLVASARAAFRALVWQCWWARVVSNAEEHLPLVRTLRGTPWAAHWKAPPVVAPLRLAATAVPGVGPDKKDRFTAEALAAARAAMQAAVERGDAKLQRAALSAIRISFKARSQASSLAQRWKQVFEGAPAPSELQPEGFERAKRMAMRLAQTVLRTLCNGWNRTLRMHEPRVLKCAFGCDLPDATARYVPRPLRHPGLSHAGRGERGAAGPSEQLG